MDNSFKFSSELVKIFKIEENYARANNEKYIYLEGVLYQILSKRLLSNFQVENDIIKDILDDLDSFNKSHIEDLKDLRLARSVEDGFMITGGLEDISFSEELNKVIEYSIFCRRMISNNPGLSKFSEIYGLGGKSFEDVVNSEITELEILINTVKLSPETPELSKVGEVLKSIGITEDSLRKSSLSTFKNFLEKSMSSGDISRENDDFQFESAPMASEFNYRPESTNEDKSKTPFLDTYSIDMTKEAKEGKYDPVVGRDREISQLLEILSCRKKNNAILIGDPGVGKSSIIEALALRIAENDRIPSYLKNKRICCLNLNSLVSGTKYRGDFEKKLENLINEVITNKNVIIFIDEIHNLVGNGSTSSSGGGGTDEVLKPYLARGEFQVIGGTTGDEYRKTIEKNGALKRRFQNVMVGEPSVEETIEILRRVAPRYESFHKVKYSETVLRQCVEWSERYVYDRFFPDKAIDCLDMAGSLAKMKGGLFNNIEVVRLEGIKKAMEEDLVGLIKDVNLEKASEKLEELDKIEESLVGEEIKDEKLVEDSSNWIEVTTDDVAEVISKISKVPVDKIRRTGPDRLKAMKGELERRVIGQDEAIKEITMSLNRQFLGIKDKNRPATFLLTGPTGTGKTELAKTIASEVFGSEGSMIRIDCSLLSSSHSVTTLLGAPASYVGYQDRPALLEVRDKPFSVVLFDEFEKMSDEIINTVFLPILDEGFVKLTDGTVVSFKNTIIIMTSNIGTKELEAKGSGLGFSKPVGVEEIRKSNSETIMKEVKRRFRPEFINRLSKIIFFNSLGKDEMMKIYDLELEKVNQRLIDGSGVKVKTGNEVKEFIIKKVNTSYGARDLQRCLVKYVEDILCEGVLRDNYQGQKDAEIILKDAEKEELDVLWK